MAEVAEPAADAEEFDSILAGCARCHGRDGSGRPEGGVPWIGGQSQTYLAATLRAYAEGRRASGIMQPQAAAVSQSNWTSLQPTTRGSRGPPGDRGSVLTRTFTVHRSLWQGVPSSGIPACASCHGPTTRYAHYPRVSGQNAGFIARQLMLVSRRHARRHGLWAPHAGLRRSSVGSGHRRRCRLLCSGGPSSVRSGRRSSWPTAPKACGSSSQSHSWGSWPHDATAPWVPFSEPAAERLPTSPP